MTQRKLSLKDLSDLEVCSDVLMAIHSKLSEGTTLNQSIAKNLKAWGVRLIEIAEIVKKF